MKKLITLGIIITGIVVGQVAFSDVLTDAEKLQIINDVQTQELLKGHYKHIPRTYIDKNDYQVDEYERPNKEVGYTITQWKTENEKESRRIIDYGTENRSSDWTIINNYTSSSTSMNPFIDLLYAFTSEAHAVVQTHSTDLELDSTQYWHVLNDLGITGGTITIEAWINPESTPDGTYGIAQQMDAGNQVSYRLDYVNNAGTRELRVARVRAGVANNQDEYAVTLTLDTWIHVVLVYDGTDVKLWTAPPDGSHTERASVGSTGNGTADQNDHFSISVQDTGDNSTFTPNVTTVFDGKIDDVRVWSDARTSTELDDNFENCDLSTSETGLVAWYLFNNDAGVDATSGGFDLTNTNSATFDTDVPYECAVAVTAETQGNQMRTDNGSTIIDNGKLIIN